MSNADMIISRLFPNCESKNLAMLLLSLSGPNSLQNTLLRANAPHTKSKRNLILKR